MEHDMDFISRALGSMGSSEKQYNPSMGMQNSLAKPRSFREQLKDQIAYHKAKIESIQAVLDSLTPEVENFIEALNKMNG